jgi:hypothetical protein
MDREKGTKDKEVTNPLPTTHGEIEDQRPEEQ